MRIHVTIVVRRWSARSTEWGKLPRDLEPRDREVFLVKLSARNQFPGTVRSVTEGAVMSEVTVEVDGGHDIVAAITAESARRLGLAPGKRVVAIIKATEVILATDD
jgi:molybdopterin-binding protein